ncbi:sodium:proton exchanger [Rhodococcus oxybenzonivorans]|uniref:Sodium:proton exchanger n=1 Tax=Rhodococcus oxybenzonivorans TaxID=1990687 RepID=A0A2S2C4V3_9NOCA|nr:cation:proton antiporter [Rhodococcus oxybenzonivorans]AWK75905.1 sodium:proton exchanger [Rhodococcus oxybenzonivorans]
MVELHDFALIAVILAIAAVAGLLATRLRQPMIVAFIGVGVLVGPAGTGWVVADSTVELLARMGIAILLFLVGLRLDMHLIRTTGTVALITGFGQVLFTSVVGYLLAAGFGMDTVAALYVALALTFSSTIIIVKLLSDTRELEQIHGRIAVGLLIVQDIIVVVVMIAINALDQRTDNAVTVSIVVVLAKGAGLLAGVAILAKCVLPSLLKQIARSQELLVLFGVAYAASVAAVTEALGFSSEVGAFLAGVSLAATAYRDALGARLVSLRDFLLLFFFLDLGAGLNFADTAGQVAKIAVFSLFVLVGKPLIVTVIMAALRYPIQVGFSTGIPLAQISEFSLILAALGASLGHITTATVSLITVVGLLTIGGSTYLILYSHKLYRRLERWLRVFERAGTRTVDIADKDAEVYAILYGLGRFGRHVADHLSRAGHRVLAVDFDPHRVGANTRDGVTAVYGSAEDLHFLETLPLNQARFVISTIPLLETNQALLHGLRHHDYRGHIALTAHTVHDAAQLRAADAEAILEPFSLAVEATTEILGRLIDEDADSDDRNDD